MEFYQTFVTVASRDKVELMRFWGLKVKGEDLNMTRYGKTTHRAQQTEVYGALSANHQACLSAAAAAADDDDDDDEVCACLFIAVFSVTVGCVHTGSRLWCSHLSL